MHVFLTSKQTWEMVGGAGRYPKDCRLDFYRQRRSGHRALTDWNLRRPDKGLYLFGHRGAMDRELPRNLITPLMEAGVRDVLYNIYSDDSTIQFLPYDVPESLPITHKSLPITHRVLSVVWMPRVDGPFMWRVVVGAMKSAACTALMDLHEVSPGQYANTVHKFHDDCNRVLTDYFVRTEGCTLEDLATVPYIPSGFVYIMSGQEGVQDA